MKKGSLTFDTKGYVCIQELEDILEYSYKKLSRDKYLEKDSLTLKEDIMEFIDNMTMLCRGVSIREGHI